MTQKLPALKPAEMIKALEKAGFKIVRQTGSHAIMWKEGLPRPIPRTIRIPALMSAGIVFPKI